MKHDIDTRGTGLANVTAALDCGVARLDASLGGIGGCPFAPGATGNIVMDDLVFVLDSKRNWRERRLMQIAPISTSLVLSHIAEHVLGLPRSY